ncbi:uncharacterized protein LOC117222402 [Megalopta genalis]|uniref:uncharacterized protein LOC117222402 n=1 Tax=Megalopta genalis TaxID=115081 RepID=UPI003FD37FC0
MSYYKTNCHVSSTKTIKANDRFQRMFIDLAFVPKYRCRYRPTRKLPAKQLGSSFFVRQNGRSERIVINTSHIVYGGENAALSSDHVVEDEYKTGSLFNERRIGGFATETREIKAISTAPASPIREYSERGCVIAVIKKH